MALKRLLDTNVYSALKRGNAAVAELVRESEHLFFSVIVVGELLHGFRCGSRYQQNRRELEEMLARPFVTLLDVTSSTADRFARITAALRKKGTPIPTNDIWIAAAAMESGAELLSMDAHFGLVDGLAWTDPLP